VGFEVGDGQLRSLGLAGMRERALLVDGHLEIVSSPRRGTTVVLEVPR
jgi:signal transduction histidine kinase